MEATFKCFKIKSTYTGSKQSSWDCDNWNHHGITVRNIETGKKTCFDYWESIAQKEISSPKGLLSAFYCFVSDAESGCMDFEDFCSEFDYDQDSRKSEKTWKACKRSAEKLKGIYDGDIYELLNELSEVV